MPLRRVRTLLLAVALAVPASACATETPQRVALGEPAGTPQPSISQVLDPASLPALVPSLADGPAVPSPREAELTPQSHLSSTVTPTLTIPGARGPWTFTIDDVAGADSDFAPIIANEAGPSTRINEGAGLEPGRLYTWTARQDGSPDVNGSFVVDTQLFDVQHLDRVGAVDVALATGEATLSWTSHSVAATAGEVGFSLRFATSTAPQNGLPAGWRLNAASSSPFERIELHRDGTITLVGSNGLIVHYRNLGDGRFVPFELGGGPFSTAGSAPVVAGSDDGEWYLAATPDLTTVFRRPIDGARALPVASGRMNQPMLRPVWQGGRLRSVFDPVSQRSLEFVYGGEECPTPPLGFTDAPNGMLCAARFWDGSSTSLFYVDDAGTPQLARVVDLPEAGADGAQVTDIAYDAAGRLATVRSPLVASAIGAGVIADDTRFTTEIAYDAEGRVATVIEPAPSPDGNRCQRAYQYLSPVVTAVVDSCLGARATEVQFDGASLAPVAITANDGRSRSFAWDPATLQPISKTEADGTVTRYGQEADASTTIGPTRGPASQAPIITYRHDETTTTQGDRVPLQGLQMVAWSWDDLLARPPSLMLGPTLDGVLTPSLTVNWPSSPTGGLGRWSAVLAGEIVIDVPGTYRFTSNTADASLSVGDVRCDGDRCDALALSAGAHAIRLDVTSRTDSASVDVVWSGPDTGGVDQSVPMARLRPAYRRITSTTVFDPQAPAEVREASSFSEYADPTRSQLTARVNQAGLRTTLAYEAEGSGWGRQTASVLPGGNAVRFTYWGDTEVATAPCPGAEPVSQGGARRSTITPGPDGEPGPVSTTWVDAAGRVVARQLGDGAIVCQTFDRAGRSSTTELVGLGRVAREVIRYHVDGDPRITERVQTLGSEVLVRREVVDLHGRPVQLVDEFGVQLDFAYDQRTGQLSSLTTRAPGATPITLAQVYDDLGRLSTITLDGVAIATLTRDADTVTSVRYANGVRVDATYDDLVRLVGLDWTTATGERLAHQTSATLAGLVTSEQYRVGDRRSVIRYRHDVAGRLADMSVDAGVAAVDRQWRYTYDANSNRLTSEVDGAVHTAAYDAADRLTAHDDPAIGTPQYDRRGNVTQLGDMSLRYDAADRLVEVVQAGQSVTWRRDVHGTVVTTTQQVGDRSSTVSSGLGGVVLDGDGRPVAHRVELPGGAVLQRSLDDGTTRWTHTGMDGDAFFTTDDTGRRQGDPRLFTPFGEPIDTATTETDPMIDDVSHEGWQASHGGVAVNTPTRLVLLGARVYAPNLGRFLQIDPVVGGSANGYDYANQNPVHINDPAGESFLDWLPSMFTLGATVASMALIPPATSFLVGAAVGALVTTGMKLGSYLISRAVGHQSPFTFEQAAEQVALSFAFGGWGGYTGYTKLAAAVKFPIANRSWLLSMVHHTPPRHTPAPVTIVGSEVGTSGVAVGATTPPARSTTHRLRDAAASPTWWSTGRRLVLPLSGAGITMQGQRAPSAS